MYDLRTLQNSCATSQKHYYRSILEEINFGMIMYNMFRYDVLHGMFSLHLTSRRRHLLYGYQIIGTYFSAFAPNNTCSQVLGHAIRR